MQNDIWLDSNEYPDEKDIEAFGDDSPVDYDPLTIGYLGGSRPKFWTTKRVAVLIVVLILISALLLPPLLRLF
jgi:hypothetical protein